MLGSLGAESGQWQIVLVVVDHDGSLLLVAEAVPCPKCGELSGRQHSSYLRRPLDLRGAATRCACVSTAVGGSALRRTAHVKSSPSGSMARWLITPDGRTKRLTC